MARMEVLCQDLRSAICGHFLQRQEESNADILEACSQAVIAINANKLNDVGDLSFPAKRQLWENILNRFKKSTSAISLNVNAFSMFEQDGEADRNRQDWCKELSNVIPISHLLLRKDRCLLFLQRPHVIDALLRQVLNVDNNALPFGHVPKEQEYRLYLLKAEIDEPADLLPIYRAKLLRSILKRLLAYSKWNEVSAPVDSSDQGLNVRVESIMAGGMHRQEEGGQRDWVIVKCGVVIDPQTGKLYQQSTQDYFNLRSNDMLLMARHKYGVRVKDEHFRALIERLGVAAANVDLLEVKHTSPVQIVRNKQGSSTKGAAFILYNSARIETLLRTFETKVAQGVYPPMPNFENIDLNLLKEEEEWQITFGYILAFPRLIQQCLEQLQQGKFAAHLIIRYLSSFMSVFSIYYRRVQILTPNREHLLPILYARIILVKAVRLILNAALALIDIQPVQFM